MNCPHCGKLVTKFKIGDICWICICAGRIDKFIIKTVCDTEIGTYYGNEFPWDEFILWYDESKLYATRAKAEKAMKK